MNDRDSRRTAAYDDAVKFILAAFVLLFIAGCAIPADGPVVRVCPLDGMQAGCKSQALSQVRLEDGSARLVRTVQVSPNRLPLQRPLMVSVIAMASSEVRWNDVVIGRNGVPSRDAKSEVPGQFIAQYVVPSALVRPGGNELSVRMSAHGLFLPVERPVHVLDVGPYETPSLPGLSTYLPAMLTLGAFAAAIAWFGYAALGDRRDRRALLLASIAAAAILQLGTEVSRAFLSYPYPWQLARVTVIAALAAIIAVLLAVYAADRFAPALRRSLVAGTAAASLASLVLVPWYDIKALAAILIAAVALALAGWRGFKDRKPGALPAIVAAAAIVLLMAWQLTEFLDQAWYLLLGALLIGLLVEQVASLRRARAERDESARLAAALAERLIQAERDGETIVAIKDGTRTWRVAESDIIAVRASDDYCDVILRDGRTLLATLNLTKLVAALPPRFIRVHKSHAVNPVHVGSIELRPAGGRVLVLSNGLSLPIGRTFEAKALEALGGTASAK